MKRSIHVSTFAPRYRKTTAGGMSGWGERQGYRLADRLRRRAWLHIGFGDRPGVALAVGDRNKLVLAALAHGAKKTRFERSTRGNSVAAES